MGRLSAFALLRLHNIFLVLDFIDFSIVNTFLAMPVSSFLAKYRPVEGYFGVARKAVLLFRCWWDVVRRRVGWVLLWCFDRLKKPRVVFWHSTKITFPLPSIAFWKQAHLKNVLFFLRYFIRFIFYFLVWEICLTVRFLRFFHKFLSLRQSRVYFFSELHHQTLCQITFWSLRCFNLLKRGRRRGVVR